MRPIPHLKLVPPPADSAQADESFAPITINVRRDGDGFVYSVEEDGAVLEVLPSPADVAAYIEGHLAYVTTA